MPGTPLLDGKTCETCKGHKNVLAHGFAGIWGHQFVPHLKHKMKLERVSQSSFIKPSIIYHFKCEVCGYTHPVTKVHFHQLHLVSWPDFDTMFEGLRDAFTGIGDTYSEVLNNLDKDPKLHVRKDRPDG